MAHSAATGLLIAAGLCFAGSISLRFAGHPAPADTVGMYPALLVLCAAFAIVAEPKLEL